VVIFGKLSRWEKWLAAVCLAVTLVAVTSCAVTLALQLVLSDEQAEHVAEDASFTEEDLDDRPPNSHSADIRDSSAEHRFTDAASTSLHESDEVIGILVADQAYAFPRRSMQSPSTHIINLNIDATPISVTYCDIADQARVLCRPRGTDPFELRIGGLDENSQMVLLLEGIRYGQSSPEVPLDDLPFERTTLSNWIDKYPDSMIYGG
jgi:hypothetical protein